MNSLIIQKLVDEFISLTHGECNPTHYRQAMICFWRENLERHFYDEIGAIAAQRDHLLGLLEDYVEEYPAFSMKPIGAPFSPARLKQNSQIELEKDAKFAIEEANESIERLNGIMIERLNRGMPK